MMQDTTARSIQSWTFSALIHGLVFGAAMTLLSDLPKLAQREPFVWTVALVEPAPTPTQPPTVQPPSPPSPTRPAQSTPAQARPTEVTPVVRTVQPVQQVQQPVRRIVRQEVSVSRPAMQEVTPAMQTSSQPVSEAQPIQRTHELVQQEVSEARPMVQEAGPLTPQTQQVVSQASSPISTNQKEVLVETPSTPAAQSIAATQSVAIEHRPTLAPTVERIAVAAAPAAPSTSSVVPTVQKGVRNRLPWDQASFRPVPEPFPPAALYAQDAMQSGIETEPVSETVAERRVVSGTSLSRTPVTELPTRGMPGTKADYGWLAQELWNRVERLKRYPRLARVHGWEGKVVVRAVIKADGSLLQEDVEESSGHEALDQDALDLMKQVCPLALKHALGQSQVVVHVPIHYRIEQ